MIRNLYLLLLAILIGIELSIGVLLAPTIFYPAEFIGEGILSQFQSGQLMTQVFLKYNAALIIISSLSLLYEIINLPNKNENFHQKISAFMLSLICIGLAFSFAFYFTPFIVEAQKIGETAIQTTDFAKMHQASEIVMKILILAQAVLFFVRAHTNFPQNYIALPRI